MRSKATSTQAGRRGAGHLARLVSASAAAFLLLLAAALPAQGAVVTDRPLLFTFDGQGNTAGAFTKPVNVAIDYSCLQHEPPLTGAACEAFDPSNGSVYVINVAGNNNPPTETAKRVIDKFNPDGTAADFSALGASSLDGSATPNGYFKGLCSDCQYHDLAVDTSAVHPGRIYVSEAFGPVHAFDPQGNYLWTLNPPGFESCGVTVDALGHLWVVKCSGSAPEALEFETTGAGPPPSTPVHTFSLRFGSFRSARWPAIDQTGTDFFVAFGNGPGTSCPEKYVGEVFDSCLTSESSREISVDQSSASGHVFPVHYTKFREFDSTGAEVPGSPFGRDLVGSGEASNLGGHGIAHDPVKDWVYVSDHASNTVKVFGPLATGTVPDATTNPATEIDRTAARVNGTLNPQGVPNSYYFEYKQGEGASWGGAERSKATCLEPAPPLPEDSEDHAVSCQLSGLDGNTTYQARLVGENTSSQLKGYATPATFQTLPPPVPAVAIDSIGEITTESAHVAATINPQEDQTTWRVLRRARPDATQAECEALNESEFTKAEEGTIPVETPGSVEVEADLTGLLPAQANCVRVSATNGGGTGSATSVFRTQAVPPGEIATAFTAPRTDTTARLNGWVNPEGEADFTYRFELSENGTDWSPLPDGEGEIDSRERIVVGQELNGLKPNTTYHYRLAQVANEAGAIAGTGEARSFTTRTTAEVELAAPRGIELVNNPDKGTQNVFAGATSRSPWEPIHPASPSGEEMMWAVAAGAPGGNTASSNLFLAERTGQGEGAPNGWQSKSVISPSEEQLGKGRFMYELMSATPDFARFVFQTGESDGGLIGEVSFVRTGRQQGEEVLKSYPEGENTTFSELSDDGGHFLITEPNLLENKQLLDFTAPGESELISILPKETEPGWTESQCGLDQGHSWPGAGGGSQAIGVSRRTGYRLIAHADASRVYFQVQRNGDCEGLYALWVRNREANKGAGRTILIDPGSGGHDPEMIRATPDGRSAYFVTHSNLDTYEALDAEEKKFTGKIDPEGIDENAHADLYRWEESKNQSVCVTCQAHPDVEMTSSKAVIVSDDFSHVYFQSEAQLLPGEGRAGNANLYVLSGGEIRFVASQPQGLLNGILEKTQAEASADGKVLVFNTTEAGGSPRSLTADDVAAKCPDLEERGAFSDCVELYLYDDVAGSLECLTCRHGGLTTQSFRGVQPRGLGGSITVFSLSEDGSTVAFPTAQALVPRDVNNDTDVYEWRNGVTRLITDGVSDFAEGKSAPAVAALDDDGSDLFFAVTSPDLTGWERDGLRNLYDARIGGGFPRPSPDVHCTEDSCQGPLQAAPPLDQPGTSGSSRGNVREAADCSTPGRRATRLARRARALRRQAKRAGDRRAARRMRGEAARLGKQAHRLGKRAKRCRRANRRGTK